MLINVRGLANPISQLTNPNISIVWKKSNGYTTDAAGKRVPTFATTAFQAQVQGLSASDLKHTDGLNIQGVMRSVHIYGDMQGVVRIDQKGGDFLQFPEIPGEANKDWKVIQVMETWPNWSRVIVVLQ